MTKNDNESWVEKVTGIIGECCEIASNLITGHREPHGPPGPIPEPIPFAEAVRRTKDNSYRGPLKSSYENEEGEVRPDRTH